MVASNHSLEHEEAGEMRIPRRFLPPTTLLTAFEAAARTGSFTRAGLELDLTQSAVSRQIRALEEQLGASLFVRERQSARLTQAGECYARDIRAALRHIGGASMGIRANPQGYTLNLAVLPSFAGRWLMPRIGRYFASDPGITIHFFSRSEPFDFDNEAFDAAIHFGRPPWRDANSVEFLKETVVPMTSPALARQYSLRGPADLLSAPLLVLSSRPDAWERWFQANEVFCDTVHGPVFDQFETIGRAARAGLGVGLLPEFLFTEELQRGELVPVTDSRGESLESYHFAWPTSKAANKSIASFRDWLLGEASKDG
jgi:LysR family glycine cleavage system transcriptional activator